MNHKTMAFGAAVFAACAGLYASAHARPAQHGRQRVTQSIDDKDRVVLRGNTRPEANAKNDRGRVPDEMAMDHLLMLLKRSPEQEADLQQYLATLDVKGSANYHQFLSAAKFGQQYGVDPADIGMVTGWLAQHGFMINVVYQNGMLIDFSGTAGQVREAFGTEIHFLQARGKKHIGNMSDPQIPAALEPVVQGIVSLNDFMPRAMNKVKTTTSYTPGNGFHLLVPQDVATIYNLNSLFALGITGQGMTIAVVEDTNTFGGETDWDTFRSVLGLSGYGATFTTVHPAPTTGPTNCTDPLTNGDEGEAILDAEYATTAAPSAAILLAACANTSTFGGLIAVQNLIQEATPPNVISMSYGECEAFNGATANAAFNTTYAQAVSAGIAIFVSSGDEGAASCDANGANAAHGIGTSGFATTPFNVAVGGTDFADGYLGTTAIYWNANNTAAFGSAKSYIPEIPWNDSCASVLLTTKLGFSVPYGSSGFCSSTTASNDMLITTASGSGGPSGCATGAAATSGVVGGTCAGWPKPSWQSGLFGNPGDGVRDIPDVSLFAANGVWGHYYVVCWSDPSPVMMKAGAAPCTGAPNTWSGFGGTSVSSPIMAGIQALVEQMHGRVGNPNIVYYAIANQEYGTAGSSVCNSSNLPPTGRGQISACVFNDVTLGDMDVNCVALRLSRRTTALENCYLPSGTEGVLSTSNNSYAPAFSATPGWDFATGIGTVNAFNLVFNTNW